MGIKIRRATVDDLSRVAEIYVGILLLVAVLLAGGGFLLLKKRK